MNTACYEPSGATTTLEPDRAFSGAEQRTCPECHVGIAVPHGFDDRIVACPACGQCLAAPPPWSVSETRWNIVRPQWPLSNEEKFAGGACVAIGMLVASLWLVASIGVYLRLGAVMLGAALAVEGISRLWTERERRKALRLARCVRLPDALPPKAIEWGDLKAAWLTKNSWCESAAICLLGLAMASGGTWALDWMLQGNLHHKLPLVIVMAAAAVGYLIYRSARNMIERKALVVCSHGLLCLSGRDADFYSWERIIRIDAENVGDAIDEHAVKVSVAGLPTPLRFTRCHFADLELLWQRLTHEFESRTA